MTKYFLLLTLLLPLATKAEELNSFEAELRMLEERDEAAFTRAETLTNQEIHEGDFVTDSVSTANAAVRKETPAPAPADIVFKEPVVKARRIRSR